MASEKRAIITLFGATGDLAARKLYPALFNLYKRGSIQEHFALIGTGRREWTNEKIRSVVSDSVKDLADDDQQVEKFANHFYYRSHDVTNPDHYVVLKQLADQLDQEYDTQGNRIFYISLSPKFFGTVSKNLKEQHVLTDNGFNRLMIEKPFGHDYESAKELNDSLNNTFNKDQIFRIDHYLGKEMIQNISALRFSNPLLESIWNNNYIDNIQVTLSEQLGVEERAGYYDSSGALRDMIQNHVLQIISLLAMDKPITYDDQNTHIEKEKALNSIQIYDDDGVANNFVRGQYGAGENQNEYRKENNVPENSNTETYVAGQLNVNNDRWAGVPFYIRTGKMLQAKHTRIAIVFKKPLTNIFGKDSKFTSNVLTIDAEPHPRVALKLNMKNNGHGFHTVPFEMDFKENKDQINATPQPYERLLNDALAGNSTNFASWEEVGRNWQIVDPVRKHWDNTQPDFPNYTPGSMGPKAADELLNRTGRHWINPDD